MQLTPMEKVRRRLKGPSIDHGQPNTLIMKIKILAFGQIAEITGKELALEATDTASLIAALEKNFPSLSGRKYAVAVNKKLTHVNTMLDQNDTVALMPPYSGG